MIVRCTLLLKLQRCRNLSLRSLITPANSPLGGTTISSTSTTRPGSKPSSTSHTIRLKRNGMFTLGTNGRASSYGRYLMFILYIITPF
ncbi:hypothetical protein QJS10_CPB14g01301 [Acorus calamus]|uniref:Uncharacterized protein n=1 Tax=Acorus calamus TaxID=4465 RepID=A0AAV9D9Z4_ACOCL|nr:hypothetical protein QJS10_CPB14g01301 [Acorus calamus]